MRVVCIVQARLGSARLPGKSLRALAGRPIIDHVLERAGKSLLVDGLVLATSTMERDGALAAWVTGPTSLQSHRACDVVRGPEQDVLRRFVMAADLANADIIVRVTGDCPFLCPQTLAAVILLHRDNPLGADFCSNDTTFSGYPDGTDVEVFSRALLRETDLKATDPTDREHVTRWMRREKLTATLKSETDWSAYKLSVDTPDDYEDAIKIAHRIPPGALTLDATMRAVYEVVEASNYEV